ncbi:MAG TPA: hypothetical protein VGO00_27195 [Kofleriaceae bacterium]|jgi:hypothetical protein|nr:hypothetical protein [Kofleriaceae bacterium]
MTKPWLAIGFATIAAVCLAGSVMSHRWLVTEYASDDGFSPWSFQSCADEHGARTTCQINGNAEVLESITRSSGTGAPPQSPLFVPTGTMTFIAGLIAAAGLLIAAGLAALGRVRLPVSPTKVTTLAIIVGGFSAIMFVGTRPGMSPAVGGPFQTGSAAFVFGIGAVIGLFATRILARRFRRPAVADPAKKGPARRKPKPRRR